MFTLLRLFRVGPRGMGPALWIPAMLLRVSVLITNAMIDGTGNGDAGYVERRGYSTGRSPSDPAVPVPHVERGMIIMFAALVAFAALLALTYFVMAVAVSGGPTALLHRRRLHLPEKHVLLAAAALLGFLVNTAMVALLLPTSVGRAVAVVTVKWMIAGVAVVAVTAPVYLARTSMHLHR